MRTWDQISREESESWSARAAFAAEKLGPVSGVADMGCGLMTLERYLAPGTRYVPVDRVRRDHRTIVCDFDRDPPPVTGVPAVACLGLLGYLERPEAFLAALSPLHERCFLTYKATDAPGAATDRRANGLRTDLSTRDMEDLLRAAGWRVVETYRGVRPQQVMWLLSSARTECT